jgi:Tol biopolymer transport system component
MVMRATIAAVAVLIVACQTAPVASPSTSPTVAPAPSPTAVATVRPAASPAASPTPEPTARPGIRATGAGTIPESFRYVAIDLPLADGFRTRLWLVDLDARRAPQLVAEWDAPAAPVGGYSISGDGRSVIISAAGSRSRVALYLLKPETGIVVVLFEDPRTIVLAPKITPDGQRFAFTKYPADGGSDLGLWSGLTSGGDPVEIAERSTGSNVPLMPLAWSADSVSIAFTREKAEGGSEVRLTTLRGGIETTVGPGDKVSWRKNPPELLVAVSATPSSRAYTFDVATQKTLDVVKVDKLQIPLVQWHPSLDRFAYVTSEGASREASGGVWIRNADGSGASRVDLGRAVFSPQWSRDGTLLTALGTEDAILNVVELFSGRRIAVLCRRGGTPPADCV